MHRRHGLCRRQDLRYRGLAPWPERLPRDFVLLELRGVPGAPHAGAIQERKGQARARAHAERLGARGRPDAGGDPRELPERGRLGHRARGAAPLYGRHGADHPGLIESAPVPAAERWQSGRMRQTRNLLYPSGTGGSNPSLSARYDSKNSKSLQTQCGQGFFLLSTPQIIQKLSKKMV